MTAADDDIMDSNGRTDASNALNSCSFDVLYASISLAASERASFSLWTRSAARGRGNQRPSGTKPEQPETDICGPGPRPLRPLSRPRGGFGCSGTAERPFKMLVSGQRQDRRGGADRPWCSKARMDSDSAGSDALRKRRLWSRSLWRCGPHPRRRTRSTLPSCGYPSACLSTCCRVHHVG